MPGRQASSAANAPELASPANAPVPDSPSSDTTTAADATATPRFEGRSAAEGSASDRAGVGGSSGVGLGASDGPAAAPASQPGNTRRAITRAFWALLDQCVVSAGTFLIGIIIARQLPPTEYGRFVIILATGMLLQLANTWLVSYPLSVRRQSVGDEEANRMAASSVVLAALLCAPLAIGLVVVLAVINRLDFTVAAITWFTLWQVQQAVRRCMLAALDHKKAILGDGISYLGQVAIVLAVAWFGHLTLESALYSMALASAIGGALQIAQARLDFSSLHWPHHWLKENAVLGGWSLVAGVLFTLRHYALIALITISTGTAAVASLQAALNVFLVLNPIQFGMNNIIPQVTAKAYRDGSSRKAWVAARRYMLIALPPSLLYLFGATLLSDFLLRLFYGAGSPYLVVGEVFPILAVAFAAMMCGELVFSYIIGLGQTRLAAIINLVGLVAVILVAYPLIAMFGTLKGACLTLMIGDTVRLLYALTVLRDVINGATATVADATADDSGQAYATAPHAAPRGVALAAARQPGRRLRVEGHP